MKTLKRVNYIALIVLTIAYIAFMAQGIYGVHFSDMAVRIFGVITLIALPVTAFTTVKMKIADK